MTSAASVVSKLTKIGLDAHDEQFHIPEIIVTLDPDWGEYPLALYLVRAHNRADGGWEATLDTGGDQHPLEDGPLGDASAQDVRDWVVSLLVYMAVQYAKIVV